MTELSVIEDAIVSFDAHGGQGVGWSSEEYIKYRYSEFPTYDGPTEFTPSGDEQVIRTSGTNVRSDLVVHAIPSNYGLVQWNGSVLTVS